MLFIISQLINVLHSKRLVGCYFYSLGHQTKRNLEENYNFELNIICNITQELLLHV